MVGILILLLVIASAVAFIYVGNYECASFALEDAKFKQEEAERAMEEYREKYLELDMILKRYNMGTFQRANQNVIDKLKGQGIWRLTGLTVTNIGKEIKYAVKNDGSVEEILPVKVDAETTTKVEEPADEVKAWFASNNTALVSLNPPGTKHFVVPEHRMPKEESFCKKIAEAFLQKGAQIAEMRADGCLYVEP